MSASPAYGGKCRACEAIGACLRTQVRILIPVSFARFLLLPLVGYGVSLIFIASLRSSKSGSLAITSFKNDRPDIYCRSVKTVFLFLLILAPSDGSAATLAKAKRLTRFYSVASLLEKRFACFPSSGDGLKLACFPLVSIKRETLFV